MATDEQVRAVEYHARRGVEGSRAINVFLLYAFTLWLIGSIVGYLYDFRSVGVSVFDLGTDPLIPLFLLTLLTFLACIMFFGRAAAAVFLYLGLVSGNAMDYNVALGALSFIPFALAGNAGTKAGYALFDDFHGKGNFFQQYQKFLAPLGVALGFGIVLSIALGSLNEWNTFLVKSLHEFRNSLK